MIGATTNTTNYSHNIGNKFFELTNHLGNVLSVISDHKLTINTAGTDYYVADIVSYSDYYPFGMLQPNRYGGENYRYGMERDDEVKRKGNSYTTYYRKHDPRLGKWLSVDPKIYRRILRTKVGVNGVTMDDKSEARNGIAEIRALRRDAISVKIDIESVNPRGAFFTMINIGGQDVFQVVVPRVAPNGGANSLVANNNAPNGYRLRSLAHEMKHAYQYINREISFTSRIFNRRLIVNGQRFNVRGVGMLYDASDEVAAFKRGRVFDKTLIFGKSDKNGNRIRGVYPLDSDVNINKYKIRRSHAPNYQGLSNRTLNTSSTIGSVIRSNSNNRLLTLPNIPSETWRSYKSYMNNVSTTPEIFHP